MPAVPPPPPIALGITGRAGNYRLAVRIREVTPGLQRNLDRIAQRAHGEVSVKLTGPITKQQVSWYQSRNRPLLIGSSIGHFDIAAGTIGCFVTTDGSSPAVLSNNHVLANENRADLGDEILQPGPFDGGASPHDVVAKLSLFEPLTTTGVNLIDAAVAAIEADIQEDPTSLRDLGVLSGVRTAPLEEDLVVFKLGRATGLTRGRVSAFEVDDVWVGYDMGVIRFDRQIEIATLGNNPFSLGGDSGSLVVDEGLRAVGLLFSGNDVDTTYANPIDEVLTTLGAHLLL